ncbi:MAG: hypothetical protein Q9159_007069 [Coniocarpon cinnabarinum]
MSASTCPVTPERFAEALEALPLSTLHNTAAEIRNSQTHLRSSNLELEPHAVAGDDVCKDAIVENEQVLQRMEQRLDLLKTEVERRGLPWVEGDVAEFKPTVNGHNRTPLEHSTTADVELNVARPLHENHGTQPVPLGEPQRQVEHSTRSAENQDSADERDGLHL